MAHMTSASLALSVESTLSSTKDEDLELKRIERRPTTADPLYQQASIATIPPRTFLVRSKAFVSKRQNVKLGVLCLPTLLAGWNDASNGALLPWMETYFHINYVTVSTLFIGYFVGFVIAGCLANLVNDRIGLGKTITIAPFIQAAAYTAMVAPPPFPLFPIAYVIIGVTIALPIGSANAWIAPQDNANVKMNLLQAAYGVGALLSPLAATAIAAGGTRFSHFYAISAGISCMNGIIMYFTFGRDPSHGPLNKMRREVADVAVGKDDPSLMSTSAKNKAALRSKTVWMTSAFLMCYVGTEVSIGGWSISYLIKDRDGDPKKVGYIASGFWTAITLGRIILPRLSRWLNDRYTIFIYSGLAIALQFTVWFLPSLIENAVAICLSGFLLSCYYGTAIVTASQILPRHLHPGAFVFLAAAGQSGSAIFPFMVGALAQKFGPVALNPVAIVLLSAMILIWALICRDMHRRQE